MADVCLAVVPYLGVQRPSIALGLLNASLIDSGISSQVVYSNFHFAEKIGIDLYWFVCAFCQTDLLGDWTFSREAFPHHKTNELQYLKLAENLIRVACAAEELDFYLKGKRFDEFFYDLRQQASEFVDSEAGHILEKNPRIVGCSSTFQEHCASLALLRRIHQLAPHVITMMGGANCEDTLGIITHERFNWVDYVVSGEAELLLPGLCRDIFKKGRNIELKDLPPGVMAPAHRKNGRNLYKKVNRAVVNDLNLSPTPDYDDYFETLKNSPLKDYIHPAIVFESSRGCWWGQKKPCTFCGLNGKSMTYRSKSPQRVIHDIETLSGKYGLNNFLAVDCILSMDYFKSVFPRLNASGKKYSIVYETKTDLSREQVKLLADTGVKCIQPGIENFHNEILKRLNKGNKTWTNIELLKWTREFGIDTIWLMLYALPDDMDDWYKEIAEILPLINHLQPPLKMNRILYTRFSRYHNNPGKYNLKLKPLNGYSYVYPLLEEDIEEFAYFFYNENQANFNNDMAEKKGLVSFLNGVNEWFLAWRPFKLNQAHEPVLLRMEETEKGLNILDTRACSVEKQIKLNGIQTAVYKICDTASKVEKILSKLEEKGYPNLTRDEIESILEDLQQKKILVKIEDRFLSLAVRKSDYKISWEFLGGALYWNKLQTAFSENRTEPEPAYLMDRNLKEIFGSKE